MIRILAAIFAVVFLGGGCAHRNLGPVSPQEKSLYEHGLSAISKKDFALAREKLDELLSRFPTSRWLPGIYYNLGLAHEGLGKIQEASERYKKVVEFYEGVHTRDEAEALYRLSLCYENMGQDEKTVLTLLELKNHSHYLPRDQSEMEVPARLAAAYARMGNADQARIYYAAAEGALKKRRRSPVSDDLMKWLPKTLYSMGRLPPLKNDAGVEEFRRHVSALEQSQSWLLRASELGSSDWSKKAADELSMAYQQAWQAIQTMPAADLNDRFRAEKERQERQKAMSIALDGAVEKLRLERLPSTPNDPEPVVVKELFTRVAEVQKNIDRVIQGRELRDEKTPEAKKRGALKQ